MVISFSKSWVPEAQRTKLETRRDQSQLTGDQEARNPVEKGGCPRKAERCLEACPKAGKCPKAERCVVRNWGIKVSPAISSGQLYVSWYHISSGYQ